MPGEEYQHRRPKARQDLRRFFLTIIITCLGLLGVTAFTTPAKTKRDQHSQGYGRKHTAGGNFNYKNYLWLALISAGVAFPVAWYFMSNWLKVFPYSNGMSVLPFIVSALVIVITASATATFHSAKAALANPAENLRTE